jgi:hypothetical protein
LRGQYVKAADAAQLQAEHVTEYLCCSHTDPQAGERPRTDADDQPAKIGRPHASDIETLRDQWHQLLGMSHLVRDGRGRKHTLSLGQANIDRGRGVQR